jgi:arabinogalactan oligomer/maltooligosaccharide transport system substrate-binding protein
MALAMLLISALALTACPAASPAAEEAPAAADAAASGDVTTITIWHGWAGEYATAIEEVFAEYEAANPTIDIELSRPENLNESASVAIPAGEGPDIFAWVNDQIGGQALAGNIVPLNDLGVDEEFLNSTYEPAAVAGVIWQGQIWGLPETQEGIALVYNKALVTEEYLPTDPMDFAGLLAMAEQFQADKGIPMICNQGLPGADAYHVAPIFFGYGVPTYVDDEGNAYLNTPEAVAAGQWLKEISQFVDTEQSYDICNAALAEGKVGAWWTGPWAIANIEAAGIDYGILPMGKPFVGIKTLMVTGNAVDRGNAEAAVEVMKYFTSAEVQKKLALANKTIPAATAAINDAEVQALASIAGFGAALNLGVPMANTPFASAQWQPVGDAVAAIWNGSQTPEEATAAAQQAIEDAIGQMQ